MLAAVRSRTLMLVEQLSDRALNEAHDPLMSPIVWDLGHIANFEELWLVQEVGGRRPLQEELGSVYDAFTAPRSERGDLPYLRSEHCLDYMEAVRRRTLECLEDADLSTGGRLLAGGFVYDLIARHEQQHSETILQTLQLMTSEGYEPPDARERPQAPEPAGGMVVLNWSDSKGPQTAEAQVRDICSTGMQVQVLVPVEVDRTVRLEGETFQCIGVARYCRRQGGRFLVGIEFTRPPYDKESPEFRD